MAISFGKKPKGLRCFVMVGNYEERNRRTNSSFRIVDGVTLEDLKQAVESSVNSLAVSDAKK